MIAGLILAFLQLSGQDAAANFKFPITLSWFTESVSLPDLHGLFKNANWGFRLGTEYYYTENNSRVWLQTINIGYYRHRGWQQGIYLSSEFGYRKKFGSAFADATIGAGYLHLITEPGRYRPTDQGYEKTTAHLHKVMPTLGLGLGVNAGRLSFFSRYEAFGEMPFSYGGSPVLPHRALHLGTRFIPN